jgi:hypothetical protein
VVSFSEIWPHLMAYVRHQRGGLRAVDYDGLVIRYEGMPRNAAKYVSLVYTSL